MLSATHISFYVLFVVMATMMVLLFVKQQQFIALLNNKVAKLDTDNAKLLSKFNPNMTKLIGISAIEMTNGWGFNSENSNQLQVVGTGLQTREPRVAFIIKNEPVFGESYNGGLDIIRDEKCIPGKYC